MLSVVYLSLIYFSPLLFYTLILVFKTLLVSDLLTDQTKLLQGLIKTFIVLIILLTMSRHVGEQSNTVSCMDNPYVCGVLNFWNRGRFFILWRKVKTFLLNRLIVFLIRKMLIIL